MDDGPMTYRVMKTCIERMTMAECLDPWPRPIQLGMTHEVLRPGRRGTDGVCHGRRLRLAVVCLPLGECLRVECHQSSRSRPRCRWPGPSALPPWREDTHHGLWPVYPRGERDDD